MKILYAHDTGFLEETIKEGLEKSIAGAEVICANNSEKAWAAIKGQKLDLFIINQTPRQASEVFAKVLSTSGYHINQPIILLYFEEPVPASKRYFTDMIKMDVAFEQHTLPELIETVKKYAK